MARYEPLGREGHIQNSNDVPNTMKAGDRLTLIVASVSTQEIAFRYPTPADEERAARAASKPKDRSRKPPPRGRR